MNPKGDLEHWPYTSAVRLDVRANTAKALGNDKLVIQVTAACYELSAQVRLPGHLYILSSSRLKPGSAACAKGQCKFS